MNRETIGAIDIGSNAIRLLINYVESENNDSVAFKKAAFIRVPIRLGEDVFTSGEIGTEKLERLEHAMVSFSYLLKSFKVARYRACATSAMRDANNSDEVVKHIREKAGIPIEIISGKEEASIIFEAGMLADMMDKRRGYLYVDVGGGSTEVTIYSRGKKVDSESFPLGTVRMISNAIEKSEWKRFKKWLDECAAKYKATAIIGSGGNINKIHKILNKKENEHIRYVELQLLYEQLENMSYEERVHNLGLNSYRADVIIPALKIFTAVCNVCKINNVIVPKKGLADGIIHKLYCSK